MEFLVERVMVNIDWTMEENGLPCVPWHAQQLQYKRGSSQAEATKAAIAFAEKEMNATEEPIRSCLMIIGTNTIFQKHSIPTKTTHMHNDCL